MENGIQLLLDEIYLTGSHGQQFYKCDVFIGNTHYSTHVPTDILKITLKPLKKLHTPKTATQV